MFIGWLFFPPPLRRRAGVGGGIDVIDTAHLAKAG